MNSTPTLISCSPAELLTDRNIRRDLQLADNDPLVGSIRQLGVIQPIVAVRAADGLRVRAGHRRTAAALTVGLDSVPVVVVDDTEDDVTRLFEQHAENEHRTALSNAERVDTVTQLAALGVSAAQIAEQAQIDPATVAAAQVVAKAEKQTQDALDTLPQLTISQAADLAEFDDTPAIQQRIIDTIERRGHTGGEIDHLIAREIADRDTPQAETLARHALAARDVLVIEAPHHDDKNVLEGRRIAPKVTQDDHRKNCPGHVEYVARHSGHDPITVDVRGRTYRIGTGWGCKGWRKHGHTDTWSSSTSAANSSDKEQRRRVIALNRAGEAAKSVREEWLLDLTRRKKAPTGAPAWIAQAHLLLNAGDGPSRNAAAKVLEALGQPYNGYDVRSKLAAVLAKKPAGQQTHLIACLTLWEQEVTIDKQVWRSRHTTYLKQLAAWGYTLSEAEKVCTGDLTEKAAYKLISAD